jgi:uncharacterized protein (TIGR02266 family)
MTTGLEPNREVLADVDLLRLEAEVHRSEAQLEQDLVKARRTAEEAQSRLVALEALAAGAPLAAVKEAEGIRRAARQLGRPVFDEASGRATLRQVRLAAIEQRRLACAGVRASLEEFVATAVKYEVEVERSAVRLRAALAAAVAPRPAPPRAPATPTELNEASQLEARPPPSTRRTSERISLQVSIDFGSDSNFFGGFSTDISEGGLFVASVMHPARGSVIDLRFSLPGDTLVEAKGVVRWTREINDSTPDILPGAGIQFTDLSPEAAAAIHQFVAKRDPLFYVE